MKKAEKKTSIIEITVYVLLLCSAAFMFLITEHNYSTRILIGVVLSVPALALVRRSGIVQQTKSMYLLWLGMAGAAVGYLISGVMYRNKAYILIGLAVAFIAPLIQQYYIQKEEDIVYRLCIASAVFFVILVILSFLFGPSLSAEQFGGILINQNSLGLACITVFPAGLVLCRMDRLKSGALLLAADAVFVVFSASRTAALAVALQLIYAVIIGIAEIVHGHRQKKRFVKITVTVICFSVAVFFILFGTFTVLKEAEAKAFPSIQIDTEDGISMEGLFSKFGNRMGKGLQGEGDYSFTSGRIGIWKDYIENISIFGHEKEERDQVISGTRVYLSTNAHNAYLQVAYAAGLPAGVCLLLVALIAAFGCFRKTLSSLKGDVVSQKDYYSVLVTLGFGIVSITSSSWMLFVHIPATLFWLTTACLFTAENRNGTQTINASSERGSNTL